MMEDRFINLFTDFGFKKIFGEEPDKDCFTFSDNFLRMRFPARTPHDVSHVDQLILEIEGEMHRDEILEKLNLAHRKNLRENYLSPAFEAGFIEYTLPDKPKSKRQKYKLTEKGKAYKAKL